MSEDDTQHVNLAVGPALSGHHFGCITLQEVGQRMGSEQAAVHRQATTVKFGLCLSRPQFGIYLGYAMRPSRAKS